MGGIHQQHIDDVERRIVTGLAVSEEYVRKVRRFWRDDLLESPDLGRIARWCMSHFEKYGKVADTDLGGIFIDREREERIPKAEAEYIEKVLTYISTEYGRGDQFNADHLYDRTIDHVRRRQMEQHVEELRGHLDRDQINEANDAARSFRPFVVDGADESLAGVAVRAVSWLWHGRIPLGKLTLLAGAPDLGKTTLLLDAAGRISSGGHWPDGARARKRAVLIASAEDEFVDTIVPRLVAAGADLRMCHEIGRDAADIGALCREIECKVATLLEKGQTVAAAFVDPLSSFLGKGVDSHNEGSVRVALRPLKEIAARHRLAVVALRHLRKSGSGSAMDQISGSLAFVAAARAAYLIAADREDETKRLFLPLKNNLAPPGIQGLAYRIVPAEVPIPTRHGTEMMSVGRVAWLDETVTTTADEAVIQSTKGRQPKLEEVKDWLTEILSHGAMSSTQVEAAAKSAGYSKWTVRDAAHAAGVAIKKAGFKAGWVWEMSTKR